MQQYTSATLNETNSDGSTSTYDLMGKDKGKEGTDVCANCHGLTFADNKLVLDEDAVNKILKGDHYSQVDDPKRADIAIVHNIEDKPGDLNAIHSARKDGDDSYVQKDDISKIKHRQTEDKCETSIPMRKSNLILLFHFFKNQLLKDG